MRFTPPALVAAAAVLVAAAPARAFDFSDLRTLVTVRDAAISPDATRVAFVQAKADFEKDRMVARLMLLDVRTRRTRPLTFDRKGVGSPQWSPDGRVLYFTAVDGAGDDAQSQVFAMPMDGGDARAVTQAKNGVDEYALSPDGRTIAYETADDDPRQKEIDAHHDAFLVGSNDYLRRSAAMPDHLWTVPVSGGTARRLTHGSWSLALDADGPGPISWSPNSQLIAVTKFPTPYNGDSLGAVAIVVNAKTGAVAPLTGNSGLENEATFAPHGNAIVYTRNTGGDPTNGTALYATSIGGGPGVDLRRAIDRNVDDVTWSRARNAVYLLTPDRGDSALWYRPLDGTIERVATGGVEPAALGNTADDGTLVFIGSTTAHPPELYLLASPRSAPVRVTDVNAAAARAPLGRVTSIAWTGPNGFAEDGVLTYPPGWKGGKAPLVLLIHGGPQGASLLGWGAQRQLFASHGYLVFEPNYRGSTNLGDRYERAIARDAGDGPGKDVMAGVAAVEKLGIVDTSRIAVSGWSYGGYMTSWLIGHYHIWKAAVTGASLDDWFDDYNVAFYVGTDVPFFGGVPANPKYTAMWRAQSPLTYAANVTAPTLILGDVGDNNVPITNSYKLYHALEDNGVPVTFVAYPVPGHHPSDPVRSEDVTRRWLQWLDKYLGGEGR